VYFEKAFVGSFLQDTGTGLSTTGILDEGSYFLYKRSSRNPGHHLQTSPVSHFRPVGIMQAAFGIIPESRIPIFLIFAANQSIPIQQIVL
jgi:hypothetical protein